MDRYQRVEKPRDETSISENEIRITTQGKTRNYITYAISLLQDKSPELVLKAMGRAINKTVTIGEIIKRRVAGLHQVTTIGSADFVDTWEPLEEGLVPLETTRHVSMISITLSKNPLDSTLPGYQAPLPPDQVKPVPEIEYEAEPVPTEGGEGRRRGRGQFRGRGRGRGRAVPAGNEADAVEYVGDGGSYEPNFRGRGGGDGGGGYEPNFRGRGRGRGRGLGRARGGGNFGRGYQNAGRGYDNTYEDRGRGRGGGRGRGAVEYHQGEGGGGDGGGAVYEEAGGGRGRGGGGRGRGRGRRGGGRGRE